MWDSIVGRLAERRPVIALDLPGFGESPPVTGEAPTPRALAAAVAAHLESIGVSRPTSSATRSVAGWGWNSD